jgi:hypothetical protein
MLMLLIAIGRFSVVVAAVALIAAMTIEGWIYGAVLDNRFPGAVAGFFGGLLAAGSIFGLAAAVFDMQRTLRAMAGNQGAPVGGWNDNDIVSPPPLRRTEPRA